MNLKDLKLNDLIKIALTATAILMVTLNVAVLSNNTTVINNYIQQSDKNFKEQKQETIELQKDIASTNETVSQVQGNISKIKEVQAQELAIQKEILNEVD